MSDEPEFIERIELQERLTAGDKLVLIDVPSPDQFDAGQIDGAVNVPAGELAARIAELPRSARDQL